MKREDLPLAVRDVLTALLADREVGRRLDGIPVDGRLAEMVSMALEKYVTEDE